MLIEILWPAEWQLKVDAIKVKNDKLLVEVQGTQKQANCPNCGRPSSRRNGRYCRRPADLPCAGYAVQLGLTVPRFFCDNEECARRTFATEFPDVLKRYARRTNRLIDQQQCVGFTLSGESGSRLLHTLAMWTSPDTLLRLVRQSPELDVPTPRVLGVDDWAKRKGHTYGTVLVDLERHRVIDLLDDRSAESFSQWLTEHPGVEIIARDRGPEYVEGATKGAPRALQIADRFHLFQNLIDALKRLLEERSKELREAARAVASALQAVTSQPENEEGVSAPEKTRQPTLRELRFAEVKVLQAKGWTKQAVARHLKMARRTVSKYFAADHCPEWPSVPQSTSTVTPYQSHLQQRWQEGCRNISQLHDELTSQGFAGHYSSVYRAVANMIRQGQLAKAPAAKPKPVPVPRLSAVAAAWLLVHPDERLSKEQRVLRDKLCEASAQIGTARELALSFIHLLQERLPDGLDAWMDEVERSGIKPLQNFAVGLRRDFGAVKAAFSYEWSNGPTEGHVNRLKFLKRQMYGRASFELLRLRVLLAE